MLGMFQSSTHQCSLEIQGEQWRQGDMLEGQLIVKSKSSEDLTITGLKVSLEHCQTKDIRANQHLGQVLDQVILADQIVLKAGSEQSFAVKFQLPSDGPLTDNKQSLYLFYGAQELGSAHLQLTIKPLAIYEELLKVLETFYRFKIKKVSSKKKGVEFALTPPQAREWSTLKGLSLTLFLNEKNELSLKYLAKTETLDLATRATQKGQKTYEEKHPLKALTYDGRQVDSDKLRQHYDQALAQFRPNWL